LAGQTGRWRGDYVIRSGTHERGNRAVFWVEHGGQKTAGPENAENISATRQLGKNGR